MPYDSDVYIDGKNQYVVFVIELRPFNYFARCIKRFMHEQLSCWSEFQADTVSFISLKLYLIFWKRNNIQCTLNLRLLWRNKNDALLRF